MTRKNIILALVLLVVGGVILFLQSQKIEQGPGAPKELSTVARMSAEEKAKRYEAAKEITTPDGFINTPSTGPGQATPITIGEFIGKKVVLVDFWTYSCINCQRTTPYLNAWWEKYKDKGLVIIGVHTPEFEFEKKYGNVLAAVKKFGIQYPVVLDNDYSTWNAYRNRYWPHKYLIDIDGFIVYDHIGEGAYGETERAIQKALEERLSVLGAKGSVAADITEFENGVDSGKVRSPEIYFGAARNTTLGNGASGKTGVQDFVAPREVLPNTLYLVGSWDIQEEFAEAKSAGARIIFRYSAKDVYLVASALQSVKAKVLLDGKPVGAGAGEDVVQSEITIKDERLYKVIQDPTGYGEHTLEIIIENPGLQVFTFTFG